MPPYNTDPKSNKLRLLGFLTLLSILSRSSYPYHKFVLMLTDFNCFPTVENCNIFALLGYYNIFDYSFCESNVDNEND